MTTYQKERTANLAAVLSKRVAAQAEALREEIAETTFGEFPDHVRELEELSALIERAREVIRS